VWSKRGGEEGKKISKGGGTGGRGEETVSDAVDRRGKRDGVEGGEEEKGGGI